MRGGQASGAVGGRRRAGHLAGVHAGADRSGDPRILPSPRAPRQRGIITVTAPSCAKPKPHKPTDPCRRNLARRCCRRGGVELVRGRERSWCVMIIQTRDTGSPQHHGVAHVQGRDPRSPHGGFQLYDSSPTTTMAPLHTFGVCSCSSTPPKVAATAGNSSVQLAERGVCSCSSECVVGLGPCT